MNTEYIDIGTNLFSDQFDGKRDQIMDDAALFNTVAVITGSSHRSSRQALDYVHEHGGYCTAGIHPHTAREATDSVMTDIRTFAQDPQVIAVGECGLDYDRMFSRKEQQIDCLLKQIAIAEELQKPLFLHEREASVDFIPIFEEHLPRLKRAVVHCFTGDRKLLERYLSMGFYIGITGWICDERRAQDLRDAVAILPLDRVMLETDAPYLTPRNVKGLKRTNVPQNVRYVAATLAQYMGVSEEELVNHAYANTVNFFELNIPE